MVSSVMVINFVLAFTIIFLERKNAPSTWAWLMVLFFLPVVGFLLYLIFGRKLSGQRIFTWDTKSRLGVKKEVNAQIEALKRDEFRFKQEPLNKYKDLLYLHLKNDDAIYTQDNK